MSLYATLDYTIANFKTGQAGQVQTALENPRLLRTIRDASRRLDNDMGAKRPLFVPYNEARDFLVTADKVDSALGTFDIGYHPFGGGLLAITSVAIGSTTLVADTDYKAYPSATVPPFRYLRLRNGRSWYGYCSANDYDPLTLTIDGTWGIHRDYANAWVKVDDLAANMTDSQTTFQVADIDGVDQYGITPRISAGNLLRIGTEYLLVNSTNTSTQIGTCLRGVNGSTAAAHTTGDDVYVWQVEEPIQRAVARQTGLMYARAGAYVTNEVQPNGAEIRYPADVLQEVRGILQGFQYGY